MEKTRKGDLDVSNVQFLDLVVFSLCDNSLSHSYMNYTLLSSTKRLFVPSSVIIDQLINYHVPYYIIINITIKILVTWAVSMLHLKK